MIVQRSTWILLALALGSAVLVHRDPWAQGERAPAYVTNRGTQTRLLPDLPEGVPSDLQLELVRPGGIVTRIGPSETHPGHWVWDDGASTGPADPDALDGLWSSLGGAITLRAADADTDAGLGEGGRIRVRATGIAFELALGRKTADGVGIYGALEGDTALWVVERQLADALAQTADAWVARRPLLVDVAEVTRIDFGDAMLERGEDRLWRSTVGTTRTLLSNTAVDARLGRLLGARMDPWRPPFADDAPPWIQLHTATPEPYALWRGADCGSGRIAIDRGAGLAGCIDARLLEPWPLPGKEGAGTTWIEPRLVPHDIGRVLRIEQRAPVAMTLRRDGGQWIIERRTDAGDEVTTIGDAEMHRWYGALHAARLRTDAPSLAIPSAIELVITTDSTEQIRLRCAEGTDDAMLCARDDEPAYPVVIDAELAFAPDTFADRQLVALSSGEARAIEIGGDRIVRQSAHLDLGVWRLDAPVHPEGDAALDEQRLESLLAVVSGLRAQSWVEAPSDPAPLQIRVERVPTEASAGAVVIERWPSCIVRIDGGRAARVGEGACRSLGEMLLVDAPLERAIEDARALEVRLGDRPFALRRDGALWVRVDGEPLGDVGDALRRWPLLRADALITGTPPGAATASLAVEPAAGEPYVLDVGEGWAQIRGESWFYALRKRENDDVPEDVDPNADAAG